MIFEEALQIIESKLATTNKQLSTSEKEILKAAWENETYGKVAESLYLTGGHVRDLASLLWQRLSDVFGQKVIKNNFRRVIEESVKPAFEDEERQEKNMDETDLLEEYKGNILIVDDLVENLRYLSEILEKKGYKVRCVTNGEMALKTVNNNLPDIILLDIKMPVMDGYELCMRLKKSDKTSEVPVIFLSALDEIGDKVKAFQVGGVDYIIKPFQAEEVIARIQTHTTIKRQKFQLKEQLENHQKTAEIVYQSRSLLASLLNSSPDGIIALQAVRDLLTDEIVDFSCLVVNPALARLLGKSREELMGEPVMKYLLNMLYSGLFDCLVEVCEGGKRFEGELFLDEVGRGCRFIVVRFGDGVSFTIRDVG